MEKEDHQSYPARKRQKLEFHDRTGKIEKQHFFETAAILDVDDKKGAIRHAVDLYKIAISKVELF